MLPVSTSQPPEKRFNVDSLEVRVYATHETMAEAAAAAAHRQLRDTLDHQRQAAAIFACAPSQVKFLQALVKLGQVDWSRLTVFHMDEYLGLPDDHPASFRRFLREHLVHAVKPGAVHSVAGDTDQPLHECERYARLLQAQPIDLCCLGIGENGHLAFNDPPVAEFDDPHWIKLVKLDHACRQQQVGEGHFPSLDAVPQYAFTLTIPALCSARRMVCVVPDARKAPAVRRALQGPIAPSCPASILRRQPQATLFLDAAAASQLA